MATGYYKTSSLILFCVLISFATNAQRTIAAPKIGDLDEYLQKRAQESYDESLKAYNPDPEALTDDFIGEVDEILTKEHNNNSTRRHLGENRCRSMNPIDRCWRCDPKWAKNRKKLAECARGFGYRTTGGAKGRYYVVTDPSDRDVANPKPGTLRHAVIQKKPLWIIFAHSMVISLKQELIMTSDKTIDGRGVQVHIAYGAGLTIQFVRNVIVHNVWIHNIVPTSGGMIRDSVDHLGYRTMSDGDGITVFGSNNVWIDHVSLAKGTDGLIDVVEGSTAITISNCKFNNHNDVMLLGANDGTSKDAIMQVTIAFNLFGHGLVQRMPRCRWGFFHVVNNDYSHWELYAIGGSAHPTIISQGNRFRASNYHYTKEVTKRDYASPSEWKKWQWRSEGDRFQNGAFFVQSGPAFRHKKNDLLSGNNGIKYLPGSFVGPLTRDAGAMRCSERTYC